MADPTLKSELDRADPNSIADMMRKVALGSLLEIQEWDSGTITASATVTPPGGCLLVQSIRVVTSGTAGSVGHYLPGNSGSTPLLPPGGADTAVGIAAVSADGVTITLPNTVTRVVVRYIKMPATALSTSV